MTPYHTVGALPTYCRCGSFQNNANTPSLWEFPQQVEDGLNGYMGALDVGHQDWVCVRA